MAAEGERIRTELGELHDRLSARLIDEVRRLARDDARPRDGLAGAVEQLRERTTTMLSEVRQLTGDFRHARGGLAVALKQTVAWLVKSRDEIVHKVDVLSGQVETARSSGREEMQALRDEVTQAVADQRIDYAAAVADASAGERAALDQISSGVQHQAVVVTEMLDQQRDLHQKLDGVMELVEKARADQRIDYLAALADASAVERDALDPIVNRLSEQSALVAATLEQQKQLRAELASLRSEIARARLATAPASQPDSAGNGGAVRPRPARAGARKTAETGSDPPPAKRPAVRAPAAKSAVRAPAAKSAVKAPAAKSAVKAPAAKSAVRPKRASGDPAAPAKRTGIRTTAPRADATTAKSFIKRASTAPARKP